MARPTRPTRPEGTPGLVPGFTRTGPKGLLVGSTGAVGICLAWEKIWSINMDSQVPDRSSSGKIFDRVQISEGELDRGTCHPNLKDAEEDSAVLINKGI